MFVWLPVVFVLLLVSIFAIALVCCVEICEKKYLKQLCSDWYNQLLNMSSMNQAN